MYLATLDRFGYELTVLESTEKKAISAIMKAYTKAYKDEWDGLDPKKEYTRDNNISDYRLAEAEINIEELQLGAVVWR